MMPELDGKEALKIIRSHHHLKELPCIAYTALSLPSKQEELFQSGFNGFLNKPIAMEKLNIILEEFLPNRFKPATN